MSKLIDGEGWDSGDVLVALQAVTSSVFVQDAIRNNDKETEYEIIEYFADNVETIFDKLYDVTIKVLNHGKEN